MPRMATVDVEIALARSGDAEALAIMSRDLIESGLGWGYRPERMAQLIDARETCSLIAHDRVRAASASP